MSDEHKPSQKKSQRSVVRYLSVLFGAAFLLLAMTFSMELRQHQQIVNKNQEEIKDLNQKSESAVQKLNNIVAQNDALKEELDQAQMELSQLRAMVAQMEEDARRTEKALDLFWQINEAYVRGRHHLAVELIERLEEQELEGYLPEESTTENDRFSPQDRYMEIRDKLLKE